MRTVARAVRQGALDRSEVPTQLWPELDKRLAVPDKATADPFTRRQALLGLLAVGSGLLWAAFLAWYLTTQGVPRRLGGNVLLVVVLLVGGVEVLWASRAWSRVRKDLLLSHRAEAKKALAELLG